MNIFRRPSRDGRFDLTHEPFEHTFKKATAQEVNMKPVEATPVVRSSEHDRTWKEWFAWYPIIYTVRSGFFRRKLKFAWFKSLRYQVSKRVERIGHMKIRRFEYSTSIPA